MIQLVRKDVGAIAKGRENAHFGYRFRGIDDVLAAFSPVFEKHGITPSVSVSRHRVSVLPDPSTNTKPRHRYRAAVIVTVTLTAQDGSSISNSAPGEGLDENGDKASYKAMSGGYKYALLLGLCIPADKKSLNDPDETRRKGGKGTTPIDQTRKVIATAGAGKLEEIRATIQDRIARQEYTAEEAKVLNWALSQRTSELHNGNGKSTSSARS